MSYSKSKKAVREVQKYLDTLLNSKVGTVRFTDRNPTSKVYDIRNGIHAAQYYDDTKKYKDLNAIYIIRIVGLNIICDRRMSETDSGYNLRQSLAKSSRSQDNGNDEGELIISDVSSTIEVIGAASKNSSIKRLIFPDANTTTVNKIPLDRWCEVYGFISEVGDKQIVLTKLDDDASQEGKDMNQRNAEVKSELNELIHDATSGPEERKIERG